MNRCPECKGRKYILAIDGSRDECYLCRAGGYVTPEKYSQWVVTEGALLRLQEERLKQLAREAPIYREYHQLAFQWEEHWQERAKQSQS